MVSAAWSPRNQPAETAVLNQRPVLAVIKVFRNNWRALGSSEKSKSLCNRFQVPALQLARAGNRKLHYGGFTVCLRDVQMTWKYLLVEKLDLSVKNTEVVDHYENIKKT